MKTIAIVLFLLPCLPLLHAFAPHKSGSSTSATIHRYQQQLQKDIFSLNAGYDKRRREELGLPDDADEYDLDEALNNNTDDTISKIVAGSLIVAVIACLVFGLM